MRQSAIEPKYNAIFFARDCLSPVCRLFVAGNEKSFLNRRRGMLHGTRKERIIKSLSAGRADTVRTDGGCFN